MTCVSSHAFAADLSLFAHSGRLIHDSFYLERPANWPANWPWNGNGLNKGYSYRYAPALMHVGNNELHYWGCSEGDDRYGDYIRYKFSSDGGINWTRSTIALTPTPGSDDGWAVCDPSVVFFGGYYYMAYTATNHSTGGGYPNHIFLARSRHPDRGYEKWNGSGWGGTPKPLRRFSGSSQYWGYGEPELVIRKNTLFLYYTEFIDTSRTRVATVDATLSTWPARFNDRGYAIANRDPGEDQTNIRYLPEIDYFIAVGVGQRLSVNSYIHAWYSVDGLKFTPLAKDNITRNIQITAHNAGLSGNKLGHMKMGTHDYLAYAYTGPGGYWGKWNTWLNRLTIDGPARKYPFQQPEPGHKNNDDEDDILMLIIPVF